MLHISFTNKERVRFYSTPAQTETVGRKQFFCIITLNTPMSHIIENISSFVPTSYFCMRPMYHSDASLCLQEIK